MEIKVLKLGVLRTNCYIVIKDNKCLIIDPASDADKIIDACKDYKVTGILVTHHHFDHILALEELEKFYNLKHNTHTNNDFNYEVIKTPGHAHDGLTFYFRDEKVMFTGDFIFYHTCGRYDLETSSKEEMKESLEMIKKYDDDIVIYPGHGRSSILGEEKEFFETYTN